MPILELQNWRKQTRERPNLNTPHSMQEFCFNINYAFVSDKIELESPTTYFEISGSYYQILFFVIFPIQSFSYLNQMAYFYSQLVGPKEIHERIHDSNDP